MAMRNEAADSLATPHSNSSQSRNAPDDPYAPIAHLYEAEHGNWDDDLGMYEAFARRTGGPILDLGCGTGRVAVPLAVAGHDVHGIDVSDDLLTIANLKAQQKGARITLRHADMREPAIGGLFALAICAMDTFVHLPSTEAQLEAVRAVYAALKPGGMFVVDVLHPSLDRLAGADGVLRVQRSFELPGGSIVTHLVAWDVDPGEQTIDATHIFDIAGSGGALQRRQTTMRMRYLHRFEMDLVLRHAGFGDIELYGSPDLEPFDAASDRMIFVGVKPA